MEKRPTDFGKMIAMILLKSLIQKLKATIQYLSHQ